LRHPKAFFAEHSESPVAQWLQRTKVG
jgi:hypothetical protein